MNRKELEIELKNVTKELYDSLGSSHYAVINGYVKKLDDCSSDIFIDWITVRRATSREIYLFEREWELRSKLR